jgi:hypothetical protein
MKFPPAIEEVLPSLQLQTKIDKSRHLIVQYCTNRNLTASNSSGQLSLGAKAEGCGNKMQEETWLKH